MTNAMSKHQYDDLPPRSFFNTDNTETQWRKDGWRWIPSKRQWVNKFGHIHTISNEVVVTKANIHRFTHVTPIPLS